MTGSNYVAPLELKFASENAGEFEGYGAIFGNIDSHGDIILPGAFKASLAEHKAKGTLPVMYVQHGPAFGGDALPAGVWHSVEEDDRGLKVKGKISALDTDHGRRIRSLMQDGAMRGLSVGYRVAKGGSSIGTKAGGPRRTLNALHLAEISIVRDPSNSLATVSDVKALADASQSTQAASSIASAMRLHDKSMGESYSYANPRDKAILMNHLRDAHHSLTGFRAPLDLDGWKELPSLGEIERMLCEEFNLAPLEAKAMAARRFHAASAEPSDTPPQTADHEALRSVLAGFKLPTF